MVSNFHAGFLPFVSILCYHSTQSEWFTYNTESFKVYIWLWENEKMRKLASLAYGSQLPVQRCGAFPPGQQEIVSQQRIRIKDKRPRRSYSNLFFLMRNAFYSYGISCRRFECVSDRTMTAVNKLVFYTSQTNLVATDRSGEM